MRVTLTFDGVTETQLRAILACCSENRDSFPHDTQPWEPRVSLEGPRLYGVTVSPVHQVVAKRIIEAVGL